LASKKATEDSAPSTSGVKTNHKMKTSSPVKTSSQWVNGVTTTSGSSSSQPMESQGYNNGLCEDMHELRISTPRQEHRESPGELLQTSSDTSSCGDEIDIPAAGRHIPLQNSLSDSYVAAWASTTTMSRRFTDANPEPSLEQETPSSSETTSADKDEKRKSIKKPKMKFGCAVAPTDEPKLPENPSEQSYGVENNTEDHQITSNHQQTRQSDEEL